MAARIQSLRNGIDPIDELSRNDLVIGDVVLVTSLDPATTYKWTLVYVPESSLAVFSGVDTAVSPGSFTVDKEGPYLVSLVVDAGLGTESTQYVRLRALTTGLGLTLVAAGERRDGTGIIPVDIDATGWADEQNNNLLAIEAAIAASAGTLGTLSYNKNVPEIPNDAVSYRGWVSVACKLIGVRIRMMTVHTVGNYTLAVFNEGTGNSVLSVDPTSLNSLVDGAITPVPLTGTASDLLFSALDGWRVTLTSDNAAFDGTDIYFELVWNTATAGGPVIEDLATTLLVGNITGGTHVIVTNGDEIRGQAAPAASGLDGYDLVLRGGAGDGGGVQGAVLVDGKLTVTGVIDPTAVIFTQDSGVSAVSGAGEGGIFISSGAGGLQRDTPYLAPESAGIAVPMIGGHAQAIAQGAGAPTTPAILRGTTLFRGQLTGFAVMSPTLPLASVSRGVTVFVQHTGDGTGTLTVTPAGGDTLDLGGPVGVGLNETRAFISAGGTDWRQISLGGDTSVGPDRENVFYVGKHGADSNSGRTSGAAMLNIAAAITQLLIVTTPSTSNRWVIQIDDAGIYADSAGFVLPDFVSLSAPNASVEITVSGVLTLGNESRLRLHRLTNSGTGGLITVGNVTTCGWIDVDYMVGSSFGLGGTIASGTLHIHGCYLETGGNGLTVGGAGDIVGKVDTVVHTASATAVSVANTGRFAMQFGTILSASGKCIASGNGAFTADIQANIVDGATAYAMGIGAVLNIIVTRRVGATSGTFNEVKAI